MGRVKNETWAIIPARGGSKSIPLKNLALLNGHPLVEYAINAAKSCKVIDRIICSTENKKIEKFCKAKGVEVHKRPSALAGDNVSTLEVIIHVLRDLSKKEENVADIIVLLEPTSPFVLPEHIDKCVQLLKKDIKADSVQTVTSIPPNHHAYNQRFLKKGLIYFRFPKERIGHFSKQLKPKFFIHGNLRIIRSSSLLKNRDLYGKRSLPYIILPLYAMDVDGAWDLKVAESLLRCGVLRSPKKLR